MVLSTTKWRGTDKFDGRERLNAIWYARILTFFCGAIHVSENNESVNALELERLKLEKERIELAKGQLHVERERNYHQRWNLIVEPIDHSGEHSRELANGFAKMALQTLFLLNGGALIALPAFGPLTNTGFNDNMNTALIGVAGFVIGLVLVSIATAISYLSMQSDANSLMHFAQESRSRLNQEQATQEQWDHLDKQRSATRAVKEKAEKISAKLANIALRCCAGSLVAFVVGALFASITLTRVSATEPHTNDSTHQNDVEKSSVSTQAD